MSFFAVENLGVRFGGVVAVDNVSFEVQRGEVFTLIGPNGAGKTTVFNLISRIYHADRRAASCSRAARSTGAPHHVAQLGIARTFQNIELFEHATVLQNLLIGRHTPPHAPNLLERAAVHCRACAAPRSRSARRSSR